MTSRNVQNIRSQSVGGDDIELSVLNLNVHTTEIVISNLKFKDNRNTAILYLLFASLLFAGSLAFKSIILHVVLIAFISIRIYCFVGLVETDKVTVTKDFGVQLSTRYALGRTSSLFIQFTHIHDVVISEVIQNLKVTFMLSFLTKGSWYKKRPIVPILNTINPRADILKIVYNILRAHIPANKAAI